MTILELAFDLIYLEIHPDIIEEWISHENHSRKPWSVSRLIADIYDESERAPMTELYRHCSMVMDGNPAGGLVTFPMGLKERQIILPQPGNLLMLTAYVFVANVHRALQWALRIWEKGGHDLGPHLAVADKAWEDLENLNNKHVRDLVIDLMETQPSAFESGGPLADTLYAKRRLETAAPQPRRLYSRRRVRIYSNHHSQKNCEIKRQKLAPTFDISARPAGNDAAEARGAPSYTARRCFIV